MSAKRRRRSAVQNRSLTVASVLRLTNANHVESLLLENESEADACDATPWRSDVEWLPAKNHANSECEGQTSRNLTETADADNCDFLLTVLSL